MRKIQEKKTRVFKGYRTYSKSKQEKKKQNSIDFGINYQLSKNLLGFQWNTRTFLKCCYPQVSCHRSLSILPESIKKPLVSDVLRGYRKSTVTKDELNDLSCKTDRDEEKNILPKHIDIHLVRFNNWRWYNYIWCNTPGSFFTKVKLQLLDAIRSSLCEKKTDSRLLANTLQETDFQGKSSEEKFKYLSCVYCNSPLACNSTRN